MRDTPDSEVLAQAAAGDATAQPGDAPKGADDVVDAEFEDVDDNKRRAS